MTNCVRSERTRRGLTQAELAERVGVSRQTIYAIETKEYVPSTALALKLAQVFDTSVESLFTLEEGD